MRKTTVFLAVVLLLLTMSVQAFASERRENRKISDGMWDFQVRILAEQDFEQLKNHTILYVFKNGKKVKKRIIANDIKKYGEWTDTQDFLCEFRKAMPSQFSQYTLYVVTTNKDAKRCLQGYFTRLRSDFPRLKPGLFYFNKRIKGKRVEIISSMEEKKEKPSQEGSGWITL